MFWPSDEERRRLARGLLPAARSMDVVDELRGWSWGRPPLDPVYPTRLGVSEVANHYCETGRDLYLRRVERIQVPPSPAMAAGGMLHGVARTFVTQAKRRVYTASSPADVPAALRGLAHAVAVPPAPDAVLLAEVLEDQIVAESQRLLTAQPRLELDALAARLLPISVALQLDGSFLGLSKHLSAEAVSWEHRAVITLRFGRQFEFHRLSTTGYALVLEALYELPFNLGCVLYVDLDPPAGRVHLDVDWHLIDNELRDWFVQTRDERARLVFDARDPGLPQACDLYCPFLATCGQAPTPPTAPAPRKRRTPKLELDQPEARLRLAARPQRLRKR